MDVLAEVLAKFVLSIEELSRLHGRMSSYEQDAVSTNKHVDRIDEMLRGSKNEDGVMLRMKSLERAVNTVTSLAGGVFILVIADIAIRLLR